MKAIVLLLSALLATTSATAEEKCDCTKYPFQPNPPCYGRCVEKLSEDKTLAWNVTNIDPGVAVGISVLADERASTTIDFSSIEDKRSLEQAAFRTIRDKEETVTPYPDIKPPKGG